MTRTLSALALVAALSACAPNQPYEMSERDAARLQEALADKVAGEPVRCIDSDMMRNPQVIDEQHILFKEGRTTWVNQPKMRCPLIDGSGRVLVVEPTVGTRICEGDLAKVMDTSTGQILTACSFGPFTPYRTAEK